MDFSCGQLGRMGVADDIIWPGDGTARNDVVVPGRELPGTTPQANDEKIVRAFGQHDLGMGICCGDENAPTYRHKLPLFRHAGHIVVVLSATVLKRRELPYETVAGLIPEDE